MELQYNAWLVDLDGTLYRASALRAVMAAELLTAGPAVVGLIRRFRMEHERQRRGEQRSTNAPYHGQLEATAKALGLAKEEVQSTVEEWMIRRPAKWLRPLRRRSLLRELAAFRSRGGRTALVSDYPANDKLQALGCHDLFDQVVANGEANSPRWLKPHPDGYLRAAALLGIAPGQCLVLGDRPDADGQAALRAGMAFRRIR